MNLYSIGKIHVDSRRYLYPFNPGDDFPQDNRELKIIIIHSTSPEQRIGDHSHEYQEGFMLVEGSVRVLTWTQEVGMEETELRAPALFAFEPHEEHAIIGRPGTILVGFMPVKFGSVDHVQARHLKQ